MQSTCRFTPFCREFLCSIIKDAFCNYTLTSEKASTDTCDAIIGQFNQLPSCPKACSITAFVVTPTSYHQIPKLPFRSSRLLSILTYPLSAHLLSLAFIRTSKTKVTVFRHTSHRGLWRISGGRNIVCLASGPPLFIRLAAISSLLEGIEDTACCRIFTGLPWTKTPRVPNSAYLLICTKQFEIR